MGDEDDDDAVLAQALAMLADEGSRSRLPARKGGGVTIIVASGGDDEEPDADDESSEPLTRMAMRGRPG